MKKINEKIKSRLTILTLIVIVIGAVSISVAQTADTWKGPKQPGDPISSQDWNDMALQVQNWFRSGANVILGTDGNVGIGTNNPKPRAKLHVETASDENVVLGIDGKVGIGTDAPNASSKLHVKTGAGTNSEINIQSGSNQHWAIYHDEATNELRFWHGENRLHLDRQGKLSRDGDSGSRYITYDELRDFYTLHGTPATSGDTMTYLTGSTYNGNLGGINGANSICVMHQPHYLTGICDDIRAFISTPDSPVGSLCLDGPFNCVQPVHFMDRNTGSTRELASDWGTWSGGINAKLDTNIWTGTEVGFGSASDTCDDWVSFSSRESGVYGRGSDINSQWYSYGTRYCSNTHALLCMCVLSN